ncbi:DDE_3 domain-containing protein [Trichonephila clavipes]|nr:DDE_3 domain-containing protein [Trichonephila clavipes]
MSKRRTAAAKVNSKLNQHLDFPVSIFTVRMQVLKHNIYSRAIIPKKLVTDVNVKRRLQWCCTHKIWVINQWKIVIWPEQSSFTAGLVRVWWTPAQAYDRDCLLPTVKHREDETFQDDNESIHATVLVHSWFDEHEDEVKHLSWLAQSSTSS